MPWLIMPLLFGLFIPPLQASPERVGDWLLETGSNRGGYSASTVSASGHFGKSTLTIRVRPKKKGACTVQLGYSLFGPYAVSLKGRSIKLRVDREKIRRIDFISEQSGRNREGAKFSTGYLDIDSREGQKLVAEMLEGKWLRLRLDDKSRIERFSLFGFSRAARATFYFCKIPNIKDRYPLEMLLKKQNDDDYL